jgi:NADH-quinone oxidoreductase subunit J
MVISARNPVHAVLFLILAFFNASGLFMLAGAEFLALLLIVVYVGAVAVLFLFVVMMLDVDFASLRQGFLQYAPVGVVVGVILLLELLLLAGSFVVSPEAASGSVLPIDAATDNMRAIGLVLYTRYVFLFQGAAAVLLVAMIGAIVLTLRHKTNVKRQNPVDQVARRPSETLEVVKVKSGQGL